MPLSYDSDLNLKQYVTPFPSNPNASCSDTNRTRGWIDGLSSAVTALEQVALLLNQDSLSNSVHLLCSEENSNLTSPRRMKAQNKRGRSSPETDLSRKTTKTCNAMKTLDLPNNSIEVDLVSSSYRSNFKLSNLNKGSHRACTTEKILDSTEYNFSALNFSQKNQQQFEALSLDINFILWIQDKSKELDLGPQECFDLFRLKFTTISTSMDQLDRLLSEASSTILVFEAFFTELKECLFKAFTCLEWVSKELKVSELELIYPSWSFIQLKLKQARKYVLIVEDMYQLVSSLPPTEPSCVLKLLNDKSKCYGDNLSAQSRSWHIAGFPSCLELVEKVIEYFTKAAYTCGSNSLLPYEDISCNIDLSVEVLENWIVSFEAGSKCLVLTGTNHDSLIRILYKIEIQLLIATCKESEVRLAYVHVRKERRDWEVWLTTRLDIISAHINQMHFWSRPSHSCLGPNDFESSEAQLCYALVDLVLRVCHVFTAFAQEARNITPSLRRGFSSGPKPTAHLLYAQVLGVIVSALPFSYSHSLECRIKVLSERIGLILS